MQNYSKLGKKIGIEFENIQLLDKAFIHKSYINENKNKSEHNERLEFLGDAVLELVVTEYLFQNYPNPEGDLTNWRSALVKGENLATIAEKLDLGHYLYLSRGEEKSGGRQKDYLLANTLEALIGAIYLDKGYEVSRQFILKNIISKLGEILKKNLYIDAKSLLQEISQDKLNITPEYRLLKEEGPDHQKKFTMGAYIGDELVGKGAGQSKQAAEQKAAEKALRKKNWELI